MIAGAALLTFIAASRVSGLPLAQSGAPFRLEPASTNIAVGDTVFVSIMVDAGGQAVDTAQTYLDYDASVLQVVDADGNPASTIQQGSILTSGKWKDLIDNSVTVNGSAGRIEFAAGKGTPMQGGTDAVTDFQLALVRFKALTTAPSASVTFDITEDVVSPLSTGAFLQGADVTGSVTNASITITLGGACSLPPSGNWTITQGCILSGTVTAPANVIVEAGRTLTIGQDATLNINFATNHLRIKDGARVVIEEGGKIN